MKKAIAFILLIVMVTFTYGCGNKLQKAVPQDKQQTSDNKNTENNNTESTQKDEQTDNTNTQDDNAKSSNKTDKADKVDKAKSTDSAKTNQKASTAKTGSKTVDVSSSSVSVKVDKETESKLKSSAPDKGYFVDVDISDQKVYVLKDKQLIRAMVCSTGIPGSKDTETPTGKYKINETGKQKGTWFFSNKYKEGAQYWVGFIGTEFLFHSVPMDKDQKIIEDEADKLGQPASHGCIRMSLDNAKWFYKTIPAGTGLLIEE